MNFSLCQASGMADYNSPFLLSFPSEEEKNKNNLSSLQKKKKNSLLSVKAHFSLSPCHKPLDMVVCGSIWLKGDL